MTWDLYLKRTAHKSIRPLLKEALPYLKTPGFALDLGAGAMNDARFLAESGFAVVAVDSNPSVIAYSKDTEHVQTVISTFDTYPFPKKRFGLITAQYALPFNQPETFTEMFSRVKDSLKDGGIFTGQFFGNEDDWSKNRLMTFHSQVEVQELVQPLKILVFREEKYRGQTAAGGEKFWHIFNVIAQKE